MLTPAPAPTDIPNSGRSPLRLRDTPVAKGRLMWAELPKQSSKHPQIETRNTIKQLSFCQFIVLSPPAQAQSSPAETQSPPIQNFLSTILLRGYLWCVPVKLQRIISATLATRR